MERREEIDIEVDVAVVGYGPVGQTLAALLGQRGHTVCVLERHVERYELGRAVHYDDEVARVFQSLGLGSRLEALTVPVTDYEFHDAAGELLMRSEIMSVPGLCGWPRANIFHQPALEELLDECVRTFPGVSVRTGVRAVDIAVDDRGAVVTAIGPGGPLRIKAQYVVGADGANSFVRDRMGTSMHDLGFRFDFLVVDVITHDRREWGPLLQICDPSRPVTVVPAGAGRRRWEFMCLPDEDKDALATDDRVWQLLAPWELGPENAELERHAIYTFQAQWARDWRTGRLAIAGDAAHLMPPFAGQGLCSGIRDAAALAWRLNLVMSGVAPDLLLDSYTTERSAHVAELVRLSVELGEVICVTDPAAARERDARMKAMLAEPEAASSPPPVHPRLGPGIFLPGDPAAGRLFPQARVAGKDGRGRFDDVVGTGFVLMSDIPGLRGGLSADTLAFLGRIGARVVEVAEPVGRAEPVEAADAIWDVDGEYARWFAEYGAQVVLVRPDYYVFGTSASIDGAERLVKELREVLRCS